MTKTTCVLNHLKENGSITSIEAIKLFHATRLSVIIFNLREKGYNITTEKVPYTDKFGTKTFYAKYTLVENR